MDIRKTVQAIEKLDQGDIGVCRDLFAAVRLLEGEDFDEAHRINKKIRTNTAKQARVQRDAEWLVLNKNALLFDAPYDFDAAIRYAEYNREPKKKFYEPRRKQLKPLADALQRLEERKIRLLGLMMPPGTGKTTLALMYMCWSGGRRPEQGILTSSHSNSFLQGAYDELLRMWDKDGEYLWHEIFSECPVVDTDAKNLRIDLKTEKRFQTYQFGSIGSSLAGKVRATNLLYADDLVSGSEEAMSKERMDKLWTEYNTDLVQREIGDDCVELLIQTPWSLYDPIDRLRRIHEDDALAEFICVPATDEDGESNFDYPYGLGYSTQRLREIREIMDDYSWRAVYMMEPIEREGVLYDVDKLRRYFTVPDGEPDAIIAVCDTKDKGDDYCVLPIAAKYGEDYYILDVLYDNGTPETVEARLASKLMEWKVQMARFESNSAGGKVAQIVQKEITQRGGITKITTKYTTANKETKIIVNSPWVIQHCLFLDDTESGREYKKAVGALGAYTMAGRNKHDDMPDAMAMLALYAQTFAGHQAKIIQRPF